MRQTLAPYLTAGVSVVGAGLIAVIPAAPAMPAPAGLRHRAVTLFSVAAPAESLIGIPGAQSWLTGLLPGVTVGSTGVPVQVSVDIPQSLNTLIGMIGPWVLANNAVTEISTQVKAGDFSALLGAPATIVNAFLNGHGGVDVAGTTISIFNGLLVGPQHADLSLTLSQLVDQVGLGSRTLAELLGTGGIADMPVSTLAGSLLGVLGVDGSSSITALADHFGVGSKSVAGLAVSLLNTVGVGNPTITELAHQSGLADQSVAGVLIGLLPALGVTGNPSLTGLLDQLDPHFTDQSVAALATSLVGAAGIGNPSIVALLGQLGLADQPIGGLLKDLVAAVAPGDPTITDLLSQFGVGDLTVGAAATNLLGSTGEESVADLINTALGSLLGSPPATGMTVGDLVLQILHSQGLNMTLSQLLTDTKLSGETVGQLLTGTTLGDEKFTALLDTAGVGQKTLGELGHVSSFDCFLAGVLGVHCSSTLDSLMGPNTVLETLGNLKSSGSSLVPAGTAFSDLTLAQLLTATGAGDTQLSTIITGLNLNTPFAQVLATLGLDDVTVNQVLHNGFPGLFDTSVISVLDKLGLNSIDIDTAIDRLGLTMTLGTAASNLGLNDVHLDSVLNSLLGGVQVGTVLDGLGLNNVDVDTFLDNLLGGVKVGSLLGDLDLNNVHLDDVLSHLLGGTSVDAVLGDLGLNNVSLNSVLHDLLGATTVGAVVGDLGIGGTDVDTLLGGLGLSSGELLSVHIGDFSGLFG